MLDEFRLIPVWRGSYRQGLAVLLDCTCIIRHGGIVFPLCMQCWIIAARYERIKGTLFHCPNKLVTTLHLAISLKALQQKLICDPWNTNYLFLFFLLAEVRLIALWRGCRKEGLVVAFDCTSYFIGN